MESSLEGGTTAVSKTTSYGFNAAYQSNGQQYGNTTNVWEYDQSGALVRQTEHWFLTRDDATSYLVDRSDGEVVRDSGNRILAGSNTFYDGNTTSFAIGTTGDVTLVRTSSDLPGQTSFAGTIHDSDTSYAYDSFGNRTTETTYTAPGTRTDANGTVTFSAPGNGSTAQTTTTAYDATFHVYPTQLTHANGLAETANYDTRMGTLIWLRDANYSATNDTTISATYDVFGRLATVVKPGDSTAVPTLQISYDDAAKPLRYQLNRREMAGDGAAYQPEQQFYDGLGRKIQAKRESSNGAQSIVTDLVYDGLNHIVKQSQPRYVSETPSTTFWALTPRDTDANERWTTTSYDGLGRALLVTNPDGTRSDHHYGLSGDGTTYHDVVDANRHRTQQRNDALGRLTLVQEIAGDCATNGLWGYTCGGTTTTNWTAYANTSYSYGPLDLLTGVADAASSYAVHAPWNGGPHAVKTAGVTSYTYDANGNMLTGGRRSYSWTAENQPASITGADGIPETVTYDGDGQRILRTRSGVTSVTLSELWEEDRATGGSWSRYVIAGQVVAQRDSGGSVIYLHSDYLGSVSVVTRSGGGLPIASGAASSEETPAGVIIWSRMEWDSDQGEAPATETGCSETIGIISAGEGLYAVSVRRS